MGRFYLATYIGTGTEADPYRPAGADDGHGWSAIDLRPDATRLDGYALFHSPEPLAQSPRRITLTDNPSERSAAHRNQLANRLGVNLDDMPFRRLITHLLLEHGDDANKARWNRLRPTGGRYEVWLDGLLDELPVVGGGSTFTESFNKADSSTLGPDLSWTEVVGDTQVVSNRARNVSAGASAFARATSDCATDDNYAQLVIPTLSSTGTNSVQTMSRYQSGADTAYMFNREKPGAGTATYRLRKRVTGTNTNLNSDTNQAASLPETVRCDSNGSTISGKIAGSTVTSLTDTSITTGKRGGFGMFAGSAAGNAEIDSFEYGDITAGSPVTDKFFLLF